MKRSAFTMIELIFVIVILGILAAVAIPRMVGVQDDARIASEKGTIGGVRSGVATARGTCLTRSWSGAQNTYGDVQVTFSDDCYPQDLESSGNALAGDTNPFANILTDEVEDWMESGVNAGAYKGPASGTAHGTGGVTSTSASSNGLDLNNTGYWAYSSTSGSLAYGDSNATAFP